MAYKTSDTSEINSLASDAKLVLSNPTTSWTLKNNFADNKIVLESQTLPNILNVDPTTGAADFIDTIRSTESKLKSNTGFNVNLLSSLGMVADYDIKFPASAPTANQLLMYNGVDFIWTGEPISSPGFIASHIPDLAIDYGLGAFVAVKWDNIQQTSTDVTYDNTTDEFTTVVTGNYLVCYNFMTNATEAGYVSQVMNTTTNIPYVTMIPMTPAWGAQNNYFNAPSVALAYTYKEWGSGTYISSVIHFTAGDTFALGVAADPANAVVLGWVDAYFQNVNGVDVEPVYCSIKRL
jgi:hypothetical protein